MDIHAFGGKEYIFVTYLTCMAQLRGVSKQDNNS